MAKRPFTPRVLAAGLALIGVVISVLLAIQLIPYGHDHTNPAVHGEPTWNSAQTRQLFARACGDCHSNETNWPRYSSVAPLSWLVQRDVDKGRHQFNVSNWPSGSGEARNSAEEIQRQRMPPAYYLVAHPEARLSSSDQQTLIDGLIATFGSARQRRGS